MQCIESHKLYYLEQNCFRNRKKKIEIEIEIITAIRLIWISSSSIIHIYSFENDTLYMKDFFLLVRLYKLFSVCLNVSQMYKANTAFNNYAQTITI